MESSWSMLVNALIVVVACAVHVGIGISIGCRLDRTRRRRFEAMLHAASTESDERLAEARSLRVRAEHLAVLCCAHERALPAAVVTGCQHLAAACGRNERHCKTASSLLAKKLRRFDWLPGVARPRSIGPGSSYERRRNREKLTAGHADPLRVSVRYQYETEQLMATHDAQTLPRPEDFQPVRCCDLSSGSVQFFAEQRPAYRQIVISLGNSRHLKFVIAKVESVRAASKFDSAGFIIKCRFARQVVGHYQWTEAKGLSLAAESLDLVAGA